MGMLPILSISLQKRPPKAAFSCECGWKEISKRYRKDHYRMGQANKDLQAKYGCFYLFSSPLSPEKVL